MLPVEASAFSESPAEQANDALDGEPHDVPTPLAVPRSLRQSVDREEGVPEPEQSSTFRRQYSWALSSNEEGGNSIKLYAWGRNDTGQLGSTAGCGQDSIAPEEGVAATHPLSGRNILAIDGSSFNSAFLTGDGDLYTCGSNESGQLGRKADSEGCSTATRVEALDNFNVQQVACGDAHMLAVVDNGNIASWGSADFGQLGHGEEATSHSHPRIIKNLGREHFVRVAAGGNHSLALTGSGQVFSFGDGSFGALGHGDLRNRSSPSLVTRLWPLGITQISCGDSHSCVLAYDGRVFCFGRNKYGQLGLGTYDNATLPQHVRMAFLCKQVACGGDHTVVLSRAGGVLTWGRGTWGQTGHGSTDITARPRVVEGLQDHVICQVSAGARHTIARSRHSAFGWGSTSEGQLGLGTSEPVLVPQHIRSLPMQPPLLYLVACGDHCFAAAGEQRHLTRTMSGSAPREQGVGLWPLRLPRLREMAACATNVAAGKPQGIDDLYTALLKVYSAELVQAMGSASQRLLHGMQDAFAEPQNPASATTHLAQHAWVLSLFILLQSPLNGESHGLGYALLGSIAQATAALEQADKAMLRQWLEQLPAEVLAARNVRPVHTFLESLAQRQGPRGQLLCMAHLLMLMFLANKAGKDGETIPNSEFYNAPLCKAINLPEEYLMWVKHKEEGKRKQAGSGNLTELVSLCQTPFILTPQAKNTILQVEAALSKEHSMRSGAAQALMHGMHPGMAAFLDIQVRRGHEMEDALNQIIHRGHDLKKPLRVAFAGEEGVDQGGVTKEFFQLMIREIFDERYGMFKYNQQTRTFWFNSTTLEDMREFALVGMVLGLAIYNGVILDVHFPLLVYKKLLGRPVGLQDMKTAFPELAKGLQTLLDYDGSDMEDVFSLAFEVEYDYFGELRTHQLLPDGSKVPVTSTNRRQYVQLYMEWVLNQSVATPFDAFCRGFLQVCGGHALSMFRHEELELLVCGLPHLDFEGLQRAARYEGGFHGQHPTILGLWSIIHSLTLEQKKRFLFFCTGCDRAPVGGLQELSLLIQRGGGDSNHLPTSHTCFNVLLLPEYSSVDKLRARLLTAIDNAEGFGLQ
ncbi:hypothetical protein WJX73_001812 [Symbiochloris irregularis]|uniref:HECT domain-containing protein n=1 Tax=Symbiochloris irregularis TaxID=706552 RepID=A0AAW1NUB7_9CHLO